MKQPIVNRIIPHAVNWQKLARIAMNGLLVILWLYLYHPIFPYLGTIFGHQEFRTNQILLLGALILIGLQVRRGDLHPRPDLLPHWYPPALALTLGASILFLLSERFLDVNTLSASLFGLASYGMLGLWLRPSYWLQGFPAALLLIGALPFGEHMQTFIGYPVRIATASIVRDGLSVLGVHSMGIDTILVFENGISKVDLPCSGVKSLWTGGLFLLAATWIEHRRINLHWLASALIFVILLLVANLLRVAVLVGVGQAAQLPLVAEMLHIPMGVLGFAGACVAVVGLLRWPDRKSPMLEKHSETVASESPPPQLPRPAWLPVLLAGLILGMALLYVQRPSPVLAKSIPAFEFPTELNAASWPLPEEVLSWLNQDAPVLAERWRFTWRGEPGSILLVASDDWRANHHPERCFQAYGLTIQSQSTYLAAPDFPVNLLSLKDGQASKGYGEDDQLTALYWLQSRDQVTDDYATRIWSELSVEHTPWVLVTILFDETVDPHSNNTLELIAGLRQAVQRSLGGKVSP